MGPLSTSPHNNPSPIHLLTQLPFPYPPVHTTTLPLSTSPHNYPSPIHQSTQLPFPCTPVHTTTLPLSTSQHNYPSPIILSPLSFLPGTPYIPTTPSTSVSPTLAFKSPNRTTFTFAPKLCRHSPKSFQNKSLSSSPRL